MQPVKLGAMAAVFALATVLLSVGLRSHGLPGSTMAGSPGGSSHTTNTSGAGSQRGSGSPSTKTYVKGPLLSSTPYARVAYRIYPGTLSASARQAIDGFTFQFKPEGGGDVRMTVYVTGQGSPVASQAFPPDDRLYFIETSFGDDPPGADLNGGDDSLILTDAQGHILE